MFKMRAMDGYNPLKGHKEQRPAEKQAGRRNDEKKIDEKKHAGKKPVDSKESASRPVVSRGGRNFGKMMRPQSQAKPMRRGGSNVPAGEEMEEY